MHFFALLNLKRKINIEGQHAYCFSHIGNFITNRNYTELVTNDAHFSLYAWNVFDIWKQNNVLVFLIDSAKSVEVPI